MTYEIEKNVPMLHGGRSSRLDVYPFASMDIGDSFLVPYEEEQPQARARFEITTRNLVGCANTSRALHPKRFSYRKIKDEGFRIWRTA